MTINPNNLKRYYSGTGSSANPLGSLGGAITANEIANSTVNALWDDTTPGEAAAGDIEYRCFYIKWTGPEPITNLVLFFSSKAGGPDDTVYLGKGTSAKNGTEQTIVNEAAIPTGVTFDNPDQRSEGILFGLDWVQNDRQAIWLKREIKAGADILNNEDYELECQFDPAGTAPPPPPPPPPGGDTGVYEHAFMGDDDCGSPHTGTISKLVNRGIKRYFPLGDYSYDDNSSSCWRNDMSPLKDRVKTMVMGNHEVEEGADSSLKNEYMSFAGVSKQWQSYVYRNQHYLILSEFASYKSGSEQYNFALAKLKQYATDPSIDWRFVMFHEPIYTNPAHHDIDDDGDGAFRDTYHPLFDQYNVDVMFSGHNHDWQRSYPLTYNGGTTPTKASSLTNNYVSPFAGVIQIIAGVGGKSIYPIDSQRSYFVTGSDSKYEQYGFGILKFSNNDKKVEIKFYNTSSNLIDSCTITKQGS